MLGAQVLWGTHKDNLGAQVAGDLHVQPGNIGFAAVRHQALDDHHVHVPGNLLVFADHRLQQVIRFAPVEQLLGFPQGNRIWWIQMAAGAHERHGGVLAGIVPGLRPVDGLAERFVKADTHAHSLQGAQQTQAN